MILSRAHLLAATLALAAAAGTGLSTEAQHFLAKRPLRRSKHRIPHPPGSRARAGKRPKILQGRP